MTALTRRPSSLPTPPPPQHVAGGELDEAVFLLEPLGLRPLPARADPEGSGHRRPQPRLLDEALILMGPASGSDLRDSIHRDADDDQQACAAEIERLPNIARSGFPQDADRRQIDRAGHGDAGQHVIEVIGGVLARRMPGTKPPYLRKLSAVSTGLNTIAV